MPRGRQPDPERDAKILELYRAGKAQSDIAAAVGMSKVGLEKALRRLKQGAGRRWQRPPQVTRSAERTRAVLALYSEGHTIAEIAAAAELSLSGVGSVIRRCSKTKRGRAAVHERTTIIRTRRSDQEQEGSRGSWLALKDEWMLSLYGEGLTQAEIGDRIRTTANGVGRALRRLEGTDGFEAAAAKRKSFLPALRYVADYEAGMCMADIARLHGVSRQTVYGALKRRGLLMSRGKG